ncbi:MAG: hypothetical protein HQM11_06875 [SAR324 cluster bacterium]|nr:hypothetical protein [SAR324 cluster bacterium]
MQISLSKSRLFKNKITTKSLLLFRLLKSFHLTLLTTFVIAISGIFYLWQWMNYLQHGYYVQLLEKQKNALELRLELLQIEINYLTRPQRLQSIANQLKLEEMQTTQYHYYSDSQKRQ